MSTKITDNYFLFGVNKYFRGNAINQFMGTYGEKKDPIGAKAYLDPQNRILTEYLAPRVRFNTTAEIDWSQTSKADVEAEGLVKFFGLGADASVSASYEKVKSAKLKLLSFAIDEGPLKTMLNQDADGARKFLADEGSDGRVVSEIWVLADGELAEHFQTSGSISVSVDAGTKGLNVKASGGSAGSQTIQLDRSTFAYKLHKVKDWNKGKTVIEDLEADWKGIG